MKMMNHKIWVFIIIAMLPVWILGQDVSILLSVDRTNITLEDNIRMELELLNVDRFPDFDLDLDEFAVISGPMQSSNFRWINGRSYSSKKLIYVISPLTAGDLQLGPFNMQYNNRTYRTETITIHVTDTPSSGQSNQNATQDTPSNQNLNPDGEENVIFLRATPDKRTVFTGEQLTVTYKLFTRVPIRNYTLEKLPDAVGFWKEQIKVPQNPELRQEVINGIRYNTAVIHKMAYLPTKSGRLWIEPIPVSVEIQQSQRRSLFDDFFSDPFGRTVTRRLLSNSIVIESRPIPDDRKPAGYKGAVGDFTVTTAVDTNIVQTNEAVAMQVTIEGKGNIPMVSLQEMSPPDGVDMFEPEIEKNSEIINGELVGDINYKFVFIPRVEGEMTLPSLEFSYFNPENRTFHTADIGGKRIQVLPLDEPVSITGSGFSREEVRLLNADIRYLKQNLGNLRDVDRPYFSSVWFYLTIFVSLVIIGGAFGYGYWYEKWGQDVAYLRRKNARKKAFKQIRSSLQVTEQRNQYSLLSKSVLSFIGNKCNIAENVLNVDDVKSLLEEQAVPDDLIDNVEGFLHTCDEGRFSPNGQFGHKVENLSKEAETMIKSLDKYL